MKRILSERVLREFIRYAQQDGVLSLREAGGAPTATGAGKSAQLLSAIKFITEKQSDIQSVLDSYENPGLNLEYLTSYRSRLKGLVKGAIEIDRFNEFPVALVMLATCFSERTDFTNLVSVLGDIQRWLGSVFLREGTFPTRGRARPVSAAPSAPGARGSELGRVGIKGIADDLAAAFAIRGVRSDLADDAADIISAIVLGSSGAKEAIEKGVLPTNVRPFGAISDVGEFLPNTAKPETTLKAAVSDSLKALHRLPPESISDGLKAHMGDLPYTSDNLLQKAAELELIVNAGNTTIDPGMHSVTEARRLAAELDQEISQMLDSDAIVRGLFRSISYQDTPVIRGAKTTLRPSRPFQVAGAALAAGITTIYDEIQSNPQINMESVITELDAKIRTKSQSLRVLGDAVGQAGDVDAGDAIASLADVASSGRDPVNEKISIIEAALASD